jgi:hypothetical protein
MLITTPIENNNYFLINNKIKIDIKHYLILCNLKKKSKDNIIFDEETKLWIFKNYKTDTFLIKIIYPEIKFISVDFKNNDYNDYREENIIFNINPNFTSKLIPPSNYKILSEGDSYHIKEGKFAGQYRNMYWKVEDNNTTYYLMHIKNDIFTKISKRDIKKVLLLNEKRPSWYIGNNGYICTTIRINGNKSFIYLHQLIMDVHDEDLTSYEKTVDHINCDKLDNRRDNLRLVNMSIQNANRDKATRRCDACDLPDGLVQSDLPKYVIYRKEILDSTTNKFREYFYISSHPKLEKTWETTKSIKINIKEKLKLAKLKLEQLDEIISETQYNKQSGLDQKINLPMYYRISNERNKQQFIYDKKIENTRHTCRMVLQSSNINQELEKFKKIVADKYSGCK